MNDVVEILTTRRNHLVDPHLHVWGWEIPVYLFLGGLAAGLLVLTALLELRAGRRPEPRGLRLAPFLALVFLSLGMGALFLDLEHKARAYRFYLAFRPASPMSWGSWILLLVYPAALLFGLGSLGEGARDRLVAAVAPPWTKGWRAFVLRLLARAQARRTAVLWTNVAVGTALGIYTGLLLGALGARPLWNSALLGPLFLASGLSTGAALLLLVKPGAEHHRRLIRWDLAALGAELALIALLLLDLATGSEASRSAARALLGGPWTGPFWALVITTGLLVPLVLELAELKRRLSPTVVSSALVLAGGLSLRFILLLAGQQSSFGVP